MTPQLLLIFLGIIHKVSLNVIKFQSQSKCTEVVCKENGGNAEMPENVKWGIYRTELSGRRSTPSMVALLEPLMEVMDLLQGCVYSIASYVCGCMHDLETCFSTSSSCQAVLDRHRLRTVKEAAYRLAARGCAEARLTLLNIHIIAANQSEAQAKPPLSPTSSTQLGSVDARKRSKM